MTPEEADVVWQFTTQRWPAGSVFRAFFRNLEGRVFGTWVRSPRELRGLVDWADANDYGSYWQINPTTRQGGVKCNAQDVTHVCFVPIDIDPDSDGARPGWQDIQQLVGAYRRYDWSSGRGWQAVLPVDPWPLDTPLHGLAARIAIPRLISWWYGTLPVPMRGELDTSCSDIPRVMRMPFSRNPKTGERASNPSFDGSVQLDLEQMAAGAPAVVWTPPASAPAPRGGRWQTLLPHVTVTARIFVTEGAELNHRHKAAAATMLSFKEIGATRDATEAAMCHGAALCNPPLSRDEVRKMLDRRDWPVVD